MFCLSSTIWDLFDHMVGNGAIVDYHIKQASEFELWCSESGKKGRKRVN
jgi:hypothetical protein